MSQYVAEPGVEVYGATIVAMAEAGGVFKRQIYNMMDECGIGSVDPTAWYPLQRWLDALKVVESRIGKGTLFIMGQNFPKGAQVPTDVRTIERLFELFTVIYQMNHRGTQQTPWTIEKRRERELRLTSLAPYPHELNRGVTQGFAEKFKPKGAVVSISTEHEDSDRAVFRVTW